MATYTTNLNLEKPASSDLYSIGVFNDNADKIDTAFGNLNALLQLSMTGYDNATDVDTFFGNQIIAVGGSNANLPAAQTGVLICLNPHGTQNDFTLQIYFSWNPGTYGAYWRFYTNTQWYAWAQF